MCGIVNVFAWEGLALWRNTYGKSNQDVFVTLNSAGEKSHSFDLCSRWSAVVLSNNKQANKAVTSPLSWKKVQQRRWLCGAYTGIALLVYKGLKRKVLGWVSLSAIRMREDSAGDPLSAAV